MGWIEVIGMMMGVMKMDERRVLVFGWTEVEGCRIEWQLNNGALERGTLETILRKKLASDREI